MLTKEENELVTRTGAGTPGGELLRRYWLPAMLSEELPVPDCPPVRLRLLGEDLVAFRDSRGQVGVLEAHCPHRGASLFFGRNEDEGLRCVYHGWKFDVTGQCVDMPSEPAESNFKHKIRTTAYPTREAGSMIWVYMGPPELVPELPQLEWTLVPASHRYVHKRFQACNYLQNVEGEVDSSHVSFLHKSFSRSGQLSSIAGQTYLAQAKDGAPRFFVQDTDYGLLIGARRDWDDDRYYWRVTQFLMPSYTMIPSEPGAPISFTGAVPVDDERTIGFTVTWRPDQPLSEQDVARIESWTGIYAEVDPRTYQPVANQGNDYLIDRAKQRAESFTGIRGIREQDLAVQEDQFSGPITDRSREHLGTSDTAVIAMRRRVLKEINDLQQGVEPRTPRDGASYHVRSIADLAPRDLPMEEVARPALLGVQPS